MSSDMDEFEDAVNRINAERVARSESEREREMRIQLYCSAIPAEVQHYEEFLVSARGRSILTFMSTSGLYKFELLSRVKYIKRGLFSSREYTATVWFDQKRRGFHFEGEHFYVVNNVSYTDRRGGRLSASECCRILAELDRDPMSLPDIITQRAQLLVSRLRS